MSLESEAVLETFLPNENETIGKWLLNGSVLNMSLIDENDFKLGEREPLSLLIPITIIYVIIFLTGVIGNVSTCIVIYRNKSMHTATNYYLFSLAVSDLLLLLSGLPPEIYHMWSPWIYAFGETFCFVQGLAAETSVNASVFTITAFTVERYVAICHPFLSHTMSKLSRAIKFVVGIWIVAVCLALPQAVQFGIEETYLNGEIVESRCTIKWILIPHGFEISTFVIFITPMTAITVLYLLIGVKLRRSRILTIKKPQNNNSNSFNQQLQKNHSEMRITTTSHGNGSNAGAAASTNICAGSATAGTGALNGRNSARSLSAQNRVIKMLVAVVVAFFLCWAPFHAQRLLAMHIQAKKQHPGKFLETTYIVLTYMSGVLYFMSTTVNPVLYNIMSNKFRDAFKNTLAQLCDRRHRGGHYTTRRPTYSSLHRYQASSLRRNHNNSISKENHSVHSEPVMILEHDNAIRLQSMNHHHHLHRQHNSDNLSEFNQPLSHSETTTSSKDDLLFQLHSMPEHRRLTIKCGTIVNTSNAHNLQRHNSETLSRATSITTMSKIPTYQSTTLMMEPSGTASTTDIVKVTKFGRPLSSIVVKKKSNNKQLLKKRKSPISFVTLAHHLRSIFHTHSQQCEHGLNITPQHTISITNGGDSGNNSANTISNSSLQDLDDGEFSSTDLVKYMGELNRTII